MRALDPVGEVQEKCKLIFYQRTGITVEIEVNDHLNLNENSGAISTPFRIIT